MASASTVSIGLMPGRRHPSGRRLVQRTDQPGQGGEHVIAGRLRQRVTVHLAGDERQHLVALLVDAERQGRAGEFGGVQVGQVSLHGQAERPPRPPHRVPDPRDPLGDAVSSADRLRSYRGSLAVTLTGSKASASPPARRRSAARGASAAISPVVYAFACLIASQQN
jgi:hypothetical protein